MQGLLEADVIVLVKERIDETEYGQSSECLLENKNTAGEKYFHNAFTNSVKLDCTWNRIIAAFFSERKSVFCQQCLTRWFCNHLVNKIAMISRYLRNKSEGELAGCEVFITLAWLSLAKTSFEPCTSVYFTVKYLWSQAYHIFVIPLTTFFLFAFIYVLPMYKSRKK